MVLWLIMLSLLLQMVKVEEVKDAHFEDEENDSVRPPSRSPHPPLARI